MMPKLHKRQTTRQVARAVSAVCYEACFEQRLFIERRGIEHMLVGIACTHQIQQFSSLPIS
jgi:hypothetical protein